MPSRPGRYAVLLVAALAGLALAQDDVVYRRNGIVVRGTIVGQDATGVRIVIADTKRESVIPADQIERVELKRSVEQERAEKLMEEQEYGGAVQEFEKALKVESRAFLRSRITANLVACYVADGDASAAIQAFFRAGQESGGQVTLSAIPLWWLPEPAPRVSLQFATRLVQSSNVVEQVIGASFLFGTSQAGAGREVLERLTTYRDERIAQLARAQLWRWQVPQVKLDEIRVWQREVSQMPMELRGGPYFAIGLALQESGDLDAAARAFLWPALVYRSDPKLTCRALLLAAQCLEQAGQNAEARQLYGELVVRFSANAEAATAQNRLEALKE